MNDENVQAGVSHGYRQWELTPITGSVPQSSKKMKDIKRKIIGITRNPKKVGPIVILG